MPILGQAAEAHTWLKPKMRLIPRSNAGSHHLRARHRNLPFSRDVADRITEQLARERETFQRFPNLLRMATDLGDGLVRL